MKRVFWSLPLLYLGGYVLATWGLTYLKLLLTGCVGPHTYFLASAILSPLGFLLLGLSFGRKALAFHVVLFLGAMFFTWARYPVLAPMNFERQVVFELASILPVLYLAGALTTGWIVFSTRNREGRLSQ